MRTHRRWILRAVVCLSLSGFLTIDPGAAQAALFPDTLHAYASVQAHSGYPTGSVDIWDTHEGYSFAAASAYSEHASVWGAAGSGSLNPLALLHGGAYASGYVDESTGGAVQGGWTQGWASWTDYIVLSSPRTVRLTFGIDGRIALDGISLDGMVQMGDVSGNVSALLGVERDSYGTLLIEQSGWNQFGYETFEGAITFNAQLSFLVDMPPQNHVEEIYYGPFGVYLAVGAGAGVGSATADVGNTVTLLSATYEDTGLPVGPEGSLDSGLPMPSAATVPEPSMLVVWSGLGIVGLIAARRRSRAWKS
jgi:hypothetical protein